MNRRERPGHSRFLLYVAEVCMFFMILLLLLCIPQKAEAKLIDLLPLQVSQSEAQSETVDSSSFHVKLSLEEVKLPVVQIDLPMVHVETPAISLPEVKVEAPILQIEVPELKVETPAITVNVPVVKLETPIVKIEVPEIKVETPVVEVKVPEIKLETPVISNPNPEIEAEKPVVAVPPEVDDKDAQTNKPEFAPDKYEKPDMKKKESKAEQPKQEKPIRIEPEKAEAKTDAARTIEVHEMYSGVIKTDESIESIKKPINQSAMIVSNTKNPDLSEPHVPKKLPDYVPKAIMQWSGQLYNPLPSQQHGGSQDSGGSSKLQLGISDNGMSSLKC
ncbi:hypothetical protein [Paenibacillus eucommiae]|uniref:Uncharacterized protein n=1 Tax=Paenibacillus eucommiae TaxID=1355755 RepID=A0ABS4IUV5_9BACL|nr:hypothetical protein [Paenibacillus eucommiae]MBP1991372.1 hypothetical protein [Paenibacillus eucommiae]